MSSTLQNIQSFIYKQCGENIDIFPQAIDVIKHLLFTNGNGFDIKKKTIYDGTKEFVQHYIGQNQEDIFSYRNNLGIEFYKAKFFELGKFERSFIDQMFDNSRIHDLKVSELRHQYALKYKAFRDFSFYQLDNEQFWYNEIILLQTAKKHFNAYFEIKNHLDLNLLFITGYPIAKRINANRTDHDVLSVIIAFIRAWVKFYEELPYRHNFNRYTEVHGYKADFWIKNDLKELQNILVFYETGIRFY